MATNSEEIRDFSNAQEDSGTKQIRQSILRRALPEETKNPLTYKTAFLFQADGGGHTDDDHARRLILRLSQEPSTNSYINSLGVPYKTVNLFYQDSFQPSQDRLFRLQLQDSGYYARYEVELPLFAPHRLGGVICINLSKQLSEDEIQKIETSISDIREYHPRLPEGKEPHIIFVGTNLDELIQTDSRPEFFSSPENLAAQRAQAEANAKTKLIDFAEKNGITEENVFVVSAKEGTGCEALLLRLGELSVAHSMAMDAELAKKDAKEAEAAAPPQRRLGST